MTIVSDILQQMPAVRQPQRKFLMVLFATILALRERVTGRNLSRYCDYSERTIARQFRASFDWPEFHHRDDDSGARSMLRTHLGAGCVVHSEERQTDVRPGALLQRLRESGGTGTGDFDAGSGGRYPPLCVHACRGADPARQGGHDGRTSARRRRAWISINNNSMTSATGCPAGSAITASTATLPSRRT